MRVGDVGVTGGDDRKRSLRFTLATDIVLLQEVGLRKPWASPHGTIRDTWEQIAAAVTATINNARDESEAARVDHGACKRRYDVLMEAFAKDELKSMRAKGSPDLYVRREELLTELSMQLSLHHDQKLKVKKQVNGAEGGVVVPSTLSSTSASPPPAPVAVPTPVTASAVSGHKHARPELAAALPEPKRQAAAATRAVDFGASANQLKARELDIAEKRLELDRSRLESEREERSAFVAAMQANTTLLLRLLERLERSGGNGNGMGITSRDL